MIRRALLFALTLITLIAAPVSAQEYDGTTAEGSVRPNGDIVVAAGGFKPNATIRYTVDRDGLRISSGSAESDANGDVTFIVEYQGDGDYVITLTDGENTQVLGVTVNRAEDRRETGPDGGGAPAPPGGDSLPSTGSDTSVPFTQLGVALLMAGAVAVYVGKRRRAQTIGRPGASAGGSTPVLTRTTRHGG